MFNNCIERIGRREWEGVGREGREDSGGEGNGDKGAGERGIDRRGRTSVRG